MYFNVVNNDDKNVIKLTYLTVFDVILNIIQNSKHHNIPIVYTVSKLHRRIRSKMY